jgi:macrolide-specific efflux system membrane fusion protein
MRKKRWLIVLAIAAAGGLAAAWYLTREKGETVEVREIKPSRGRIVTEISTTGTVQPQNRVAIKPAISGRVEQILVKEGDAVTAGQVLAIMSSTDRAALLDAARERGPEALKYWEDAYKPFPLVAPINGEVIVKSVEPGQTVATSDAVLVLSDRLIVKAQVDETDIGKIKVGQSARISLDAYPELKVRAAVDHIAYESKVVSNVTIYEVDILPKKVPEVFRSGMSANVSIIEEEKENALLLPVEAVQKSNDGNFVTVKTGPDEKPARREIELGLVNDRHVEIVSGIDDDTVVTISSRKYTLEKQSQSGTNPFMPARPGGRSGSGGGQRPGR